MENVTHLQGDPKNKNLHPVQRDGNTDLSLSIRPPESAAYNRIKIFLMTQADLRGIIYKGQIVVTQSCLINNCTM